MLNKVYIILKKLHVCIKYCETYLKNEYFSCGSVNIEFAI